MGRRRRTPKGVALLRVTVYHIGALKTKSGTITVFMAACGPCFISDDVGGGLRFIPGGLDRSIMHGGRGADEYLVIEKGVYPADILASGLYLEIDPATGLREEDLPVGERSVNE